MLIIKKNNRTKSCYKEMLTSILRTLVKNLVKENFYEKKKIIF